MAKVSKAAKTFSIMVKATLDFNIDVRADSLADALDVASKLTIADIEAALPPEGSYNDYKIDVQGVYKNE